jgi:hypothetical protein
VSRRGYEARIIVGYDSFARSVVRLAVLDADRNAYLMPDGSWQTVAEGELIQDMGVLLPAGSIEAIAVAIAEYQGHTSHADTEARVLREWLAVERARVDKALP